MKLPSMGPPLLIAYGNISTQMSSYNTIVAAVDFKDGWQPNHGILSETSWLAGYLDT